MIPTTVGDDEPREVDEDEARSSQMLQLQQNGVAKGARRVTSEQVIRQLQNLMCRPDQHRRFG